MKVRGASIIVVVQDIVLIDSLVGKRMVGLNSKERLNMSINTIRQLQMVNRITLACMHDEPNYWMSSDQLLLEKLEVSIVLWRCSVLVVETLAFQLQVLQGQIDVFSKDLMVVGAPTARTLR